MYAISCCIKMCCNGIQLYIYIDMPIFYVIKCMGKLCQKKQQTNTFLPILSWIFSQKGHWDMLLALVLIGQQWFGQWLDALRHRVVIDKGHWHITSPGSNGLTHWGRDNMDAISQTTLLNAFSWMKMLEFSKNSSLKFVPKGLINNIPALVQIMAWRRPGNKPLSEPMIVVLPTHICVTRPQWVNQ